MNIGISGLTSAAEQINLVSRNVARAKDPGAVRKEAQVITAPGGGVSVVGVRRSANAALLAALLDATAKASASQSLLQGLDQLDVTRSDGEIDSTPAAALGRMRAALHLFANEPQSSAAGRVAMTAATDMVTTLRRATDATNAARLDADKQIAAAVENVNTLLARFEVVDRAIVAGSSSGRDITDYEDERDGLLKRIAEQIGIRTLTSSNGSTVIHTDSGIPLFETTARRLAFAPAVSLQPGVLGSPVYIDGVAAAGTGEMMPIETGRIRSLVAVRDEITVTYQAQLDEIARGLIEAFAESDQSGAGLPDRAGIFLDGASAVVPVAASISNGLAGRIAIHPLADPDRGGSTAYLRDGGLGGASFVYNTAGLSGFSARLNQLIEEFDAARPFDPAARSGSSETLPGYAANSIAWLQGERQAAADQQDFATALHERISDTISNETGINLDEEMIEMLALERSYQASSRLISVIDKMFEALISAAG